MSRAALHSAPRAIASRRAEVFQNLLLSTLAVTANLPVGKSADLGSTARTTSTQGPRSIEVFQQPYQQRFAARLPVGQSGDWENPITQWRNRSDFQGRNHVLFGAIATAPAIGVETGGSAQRLGAGFRAEPQSTNLLLFPNAVATTPAFSNETQGGIRPLVTALRAEPQSRSLQLLTTPPIPVISNEITGRAVSQTNRRDDQFGLNLLLTQVQSSIATPILQVNFDRPVASVPAKFPDVLGSAYALFQPLSVPVRGFDFSIPQRNWRNRENLPGVNLQLFVQAPTVPAVYVPSGRIAVVELKLKTLSITWK